MEITIHIVGAVYIPGVYTLPNGARVNDVLVMAGGATESADLARINLAAFVHDAMQIIVPETGEDIAEVFIFSESPSGALSAASSSAGTSVATAAQANGGLVNINTATQAELQTLPGVGPVLSQNIIDTRMTHGNFSRVDELIHVPGIGQATMARLRPLVTVD